MPVYVVIKSRTKSVFILLLAALSMASHVARAQSVSEQERIAAVMVIVTDLLLAEQTVSHLELSLNAIINQQNTIADGLIISFPRDNQDLEFCFVINQHQEDLSVSINGSNQTLEEGENCFFISENAQQETNQAVFNYAAGSGQSQISLIDVATSSPSRALLSSVKRSQWDERAVSKVLKIFAFGGHATQSQIGLWANMRPYDAISEMLNFDEHNALLSPMAKSEIYNETRNQHGTFREFLEFISNPASNHPIPVENREQYGIDGYRFDESFLRMATVRGLNPFRQRIAFWETNYHLATNRNASVSREQMVTYYDDIMQAHEAGLAYHQVMGVAAKSAAAAMQYGHSQNKWNEEDQICECNDDFAREIHQLYYGIFGEGDSSHENVTIPETAKMLTGMPVSYISTVDFTGFDIHVSFDKGVEDGDHHLGPVNILSQSISGSDAAEKIDNLMPLSMQHPESLNNLPIMIISTLADNNLNQVRSDELRTSWAAMGVNRTLLEFIRNYAISKSFHSQQQFKYLTSHERALYLANKRNLDNVEAFTSGENYIERKGRDIEEVIEDDFAGEVFRPLHNVFGGQTSTEASDSAVAFENNYNDIVERDSYQLSETLCDDCDEGQPWQKKWADVLPQREDGNYYVSDAAQWLWNHAVGNMDNYTSLEKAHLYALIGATSIDPSGDHQGEYFFDLNYLLCVVADYQVQESSNSTDLSQILSRASWYNYPYCREEDGLAEHETQQLERALTGEQIAQDALIQDLLLQLGETIIPINQSIETTVGRNERRYALRRIDTALDFIFATPFVFAEGSQ